MKTFFKKSVAFCLLASLLMSVGCKKNANNQESGSITPAVKYEVWGADNLVSVVQETTYNADYRKSSAKLEYAMAKGEIEYDQIIVTANEDISAIELKASDLKSGDNVIPASDIQVYLQRYIYCNDETKWDGKMGVKDHLAYNDAYYPDMLMYMDVAKKFSENTVKKGNNQGFTVQIQTKTNTTAGVYSGNFTLIVDGEETAIPVSVTVWDIEMGNSTGKTLFYTHNGTPLFNGEFDSTVEMQRKYYELCLDWNICQEYFPGHGSFRYNTDVEAFISEIERYWDHPHFTAYNIPNYETGGWGQIEGTGRELIKTYIREIIKASTPERNYLSKLSINHDSLDEPQLSNSYERVGTIYETFHEIENELVIEMKSEGWFADNPAFEAEMEHLILNIPQVMTSPYCDELLYNGSYYSTANVNAWCPSIEEFDTQIERDLYLEQESLSGGEQWFYTSNQPQFPYVSHFTQAQPVGNRVLRWIQYDLGITGYLYWQVNFNAEDDLRDPYKDSQVWDLNPNGDGYFFYSGRAYESDPFPTAKLLAFNDGQEDMDMLYMLEDLYKSVCKDYGYTDVEAEKMYDELQSTMFDRIIDGATNSFEYQDLLDLRTEIAHMILMLQKGELVTYEIDVDKANWTVLSKASSISVNGENVSGELTGVGYKFSGVITLNKTITLSVKTQDNEIKLFVSKERKLVAFNSSHITASGESTTIVDNNVLNFSVVTKTDDVTYTPYINIKAATFGISSFAEMDMLTFDYHNSSAETYVLTVNVVKGSNGIMLEEYTIPAGETVHICIPLIYNNQNGVGYIRHISKTDTLQFVLNSESGNTLTGTISNMTFTKAGE